MKTANILLAFIVVSVAACGGGGDDPAPEQAQTSLTCSIPAAAIPPNVQFVKPGVSGGVLFPALGASLAAIVALECKP